MGGCCKQELAINYDIRIVSLSMPIVLFCYLKVRYETYLRHPNLLSFTNLSSQGHCLCYLFLQLLHLCLHSFLQIFNPGNNRAQSGPHLLDVQVSHSCLTLHQRQSLHQSILQRQPPLKHTLLDLQRLFLQLERLILRPVRLLSDIIRFVYSCVSLVSNRVRLFSYFPTGVPGAFFSGNMFGNFKACSGHIGSQQDHTCKENQGRWSLHINR